MKIPETGRSDLRKEWSARRGSHGVDPHILMVLFGDPSWSKRWFNYLQNESVEALSSR